MRLMLRVAGRVRFAEQVSSQRHAGGRLSKKVLCYMTTSGRAKTSSGPASLYTGRTGKRSRDMSDVMLLRKVIPSLRSLLAQLQRSRLNALGTSEG
jgi:hypothetical protein